MIRKDYTSIMDYFELMEWARERQRKQRRRVMAVLLVTCGGGLALSLVYLLNQVR